MREPLLRHPDLGNPAECTVSWHLEEGLSANIINEEPNSPFAKPQPMSKMAMMAKPINHTRFLPYRSANRPDKSKKHACRYKRQMRRSTTMRIGYALRLLHRH